MPIPGSSRRHRRREPSDAIEEDDTQRAAEDVDVEENEQPRRSAKSVKKEKQKAAKAEGENQDPLKALKDRPLDRAHAPKLQGFASDWSMMKRQGLDPFFGLMRDVSAVFAEFMDGEMAEKALVEMDHIVRDLLDTEYELTAHDKTLSDLYQKLMRDEVVVGVVDQYQEGVKRRLDEYKQKTTRQKYGKAEEYKSFKQAIFDVQNPDIAMPPITDFISKEPGDDSDDDDDVEVGGVTQDYKCPLTLTILVDPLKSVVCGHAFSRAAIEDYLSTREIKKCPASGCNKNISRKDLVPDKELAKKAKDVARRERMREEDSDEDEVIE